MQVAVQIVHPLTLLLALAVAVGYDPYRVGESLAGRETSCEMKANVVAQICGTSNAWKVAEPSDPVAAIQQREVLLEIQGDPKNGYHLIMSPRGCFTADSWHETIEDAKDAAQELFDARSEAWC